MNIQDLEKQFKREFDQVDTKTFFSPSRINIIGEHIDYNGGSVFPCAIEIGTYAIAAKRDDNIISLISTNFSHRDSFEIQSDLIYCEDKQWVNYPMGMVWSMMKRGFKVGGLNILISGNIPNGAGLSSSASLELLIGEIINVLYNDGNIDKMDLVLAGKETENDFIGVHSGVMDQFVIGMGKKDNAILLDTETLSYGYVPLKLDGYRFVIMNTRKRRELKDSKYNERRQECERAKELLSSLRPLNHLCELDEDEFDSLSYVLTGTLLRRARHVVTENTRVKAVINAIENKDMPELGRLLNASHHSLKEDFEVTGIELDTLVSLAQIQQGCLGARMTGAGFGGCAIALVKNEEVEDFISSVSKAYAEKIGHEGEFFVSGIDDGVREL